MPESVLVDRGAAFVGAQLLRACASLGARLVHAPPRSPSTKGKVERFFRTVRAQLLVEVESRGVADLAELNSLVDAWVEVVYHRVVHSEAGSAPLERLMADGPPALVPPEVLHEAFLWAETRVVTKTWV